jgi:hypothetical protein
MDSQALISLGKIDLEVALLLSAKNGINVDFIQSSNYLLDVINYIYSRKPTTPIISKLIELFNKADSFSILIDALQKIGENIIKNIDSFVHFDVQSHPLGLPSNLIVNQDLLDSMSDNKNHEAFLGLFWLFAILFEKGRESFVIFSLEDSGLGKIFKTRYRSIFIADIQKVLEKYHLTAKETRIIQDWTNRKMNFYKRDMSIERK